MLSIGCAAGGCYSAGPRVVLVRAKAGTNAEPVQLAEDAWARVLVPLADGTTVISGNRVKLEAGAWYFEADPKP